jgi:aspartokinase-like uncharacterized kinase
MTGPVVLKVGGSLLDWSELPRRLGAILEAGRVAGRRQVVLAGGGGAADFVRQLDRTFALGDAAAHRLALRALDLTAHALAALVPSLGLDVVDEPAVFQPLWERGRIPLFAPRRFLAETDASSPDPLPFSWDVTSDTIAARLAVHLGAAELVLLKSQGLPPGTDRHTAARLGLVDPCFPEASRSLPRVVLIDLRAEGSVPFLLERKRGGPGRLRRLDGDDSSGPESRE